MYKVLLVDDEPIILSGIKFLVNWSLLSCQIIATARNGREAMDIIKHEIPDIVVCDINMPVMSGLEVLAACAEQSVQPVFIMLTNHQDFDMARESMRFKAVDYLVKSNLEPETLENALRRAIAECDKRGKLMRVELVDVYMQENRAEIIENSVKKLLFSADKNRNVFTKAIEALHENSADKSFFAAQLMLDFTSLPAISGFSAHEKTRLYNWEREVVEKLARNVFSHYVLFDPDGYHQSIVLYLWNVSAANIKDALHRFFAKLESASGNITQTRLSLLASNLYEDEGGFDKIKVELAHARDYYYLTKATQIYAWSLTEIDYKTPDAQEFSNRLLVELRAKNAAQCAALLDKAQGMLSNLPHTRIEGIRCCAELYGVISMVLTPQLTDGLQSTYLANNSQMIEAVHRFYTFSEVLLWISELKRQTLSVLEGLTYGKSELMEKAKQYIVSNADKRIMLADVADYVSISPSYLSAMFKKEYNQNIVDFINETKINLACELIREGKYRIYEISYKLAFENAYYFTKVFKRYTGHTPTEYQRRIRKEATV